MPEKILVETNTRVKKTIPETRKRLVLSIESKQPI